MKCAACGSDAPAGSAFCPKCGKSFAATREGAGPFSSPAAEAREPDRVGVAGEFSPVIWEGSYCARAMIGSWIGAGILTIVLGVAAWFIQGMAPQHAMWIWIGAGSLALIFWLYLLVIFAYRTLSISYRLTDDLLIHQRGILFVTIDRVEMVDIDDLAIEQGLVDRMVGTGTIRILSSDVSDPVLEMIGIESVQEVFMKIDAARRRRRSKIVHVEGV